MRWTLKFIRAQRQDDGTIPFDPEMESDRCRGQRWCAMRDGLLDRSDTTSGVWADTAYRLKANEAITEK
ncbi:hypothetical protein AA18889_0760 [Acetobacter senegalensis DSM 18889]|nr:hypothetical protein AA18889_0760 [Acetobacter senegalensis DSM 18889]